MSNPIANDESRLKPLLRGRPPCGRLWEAAPVKRDRDMPGDSRLKPLLHQYGPGGVALRRGGNQNGLSTTVALAITRDQCISR